MTHGLDEANELPLVSCQLKMAQSERSAEESEGPIALMKNGAEPGARGVTVHHERAVEVGHLEDGACCEGPLEGLERRRRLVVPSEGVAAKQPREGRRDESEFPDKFPVVADEAEEPAESPRRVRRRPGGDGRHLIGVHSHPVSRDDMAEVGDGRCPERALRAFKVEMVRPKLVEDDGDVLEMFGPGGAVDKNVIKENKHKPP